MKMRIEPPAPIDAYVLVSENWYPDWNATVDGVAASVFRADMSLLSVPVPAGATVVELRFESKAYVVGKTVTFACLFLVLIAAVLPQVWRRRTNG